MKISNFLFVFFFEVDVIISQFFFLTFFGSFFLILLVLVTTLSTAFRRGLSLIVVVYLEVEACDTFWWYSVDTTAEFSSDSVSSLGWAVWSKFILNVVVSFFSRNKEKIGVFYVNVFIVEFTAVDLKINVHDVVIYMPRFELHL